MNILLDKNYPEQTQRQYHRRIVTSLSKPFDFGKLS